MSDFSAEQLIEKFVLPQLERIDQKLDTKADLILVTDLAGRVTELERHGSQGAQELTRRVASLHERMGTAANALVVQRNSDAIESLKLWRSRMLGAMAVLAPVALTALGFALDHYI